MVEYKGGETMKIYFVNSVLDYGSTGKIVRDLASQLLVEGHEVRMAYGRKDVKDSNHTFSLVSSTSFIYHYLMSRCFDRHGLHSTFQTKKLIRDIEDFNPDTIHIHNLHGYYLNVPLFLEAIKKMNKKVIITLHDAWLVSGSNAYFDFDGCAIWNNGCVVSNNPKSYPRADLFLRQAKNFAWKENAFKGFSNLTFISPSIWLKDLIQTTFLKKYPIAVVNNGIDTSVFYERKDSPLKEEYKDKKVILAVASVWEARKGLADIIKLSKLLDESYQIIIIGLSDKQLADLPNKIIGIKRTNDANQLAEYYSIAHAYINPTYEDNYPTTNLEARACNANIVAYDTGGNKEIKDAIIVEQGNVEAMAKAIIALEGKIINKVDYSKEKFIKEMLEYY